MTYNNKERTQTDSIQEEELLVIRTVTKDSFRRRLRVVQFVVNGQTRAPKIDNRLYRDGDTNPHGRTVSLDFADAEAIVANWAQIKSCWFGK